MCDVQVLSDESGDNKIVSIDNPAAFITLLEEAENTGKENLTVTINAESDDLNCRNSDGDIVMIDCNRSRWNVSQSLGYARNCSLKSLTLTINDFGFESTGMPDFLIGCLKGCISLNSLILTLNDHSYYDQASASLLRKGLGCNTSLISVTLTVNIYARVFVDIRYREEIDSFVPNTSMKYFTLTINDFCRSRSWKLGSDVLWSNFKSITTFNLTFNNSDELIGHELAIFWMQ